MGTSGYQDVAAVECCSVSAAEFGEAPGGGTVHGTEDSKHVFPLGGTSFLSCRLRPIIWNVYNR